MAGITPVLYMVLAGPYRALHLRLLARQANGTLYQRWYGLRNDLFECVMKVMETLIFVGNSLVSCPPGSPPGELAAVNVIRPRYE